MISMAPSKFLHMKLLLIFDKYMISILFALLSTNRRYKGHLVYQLVPPSYLIIQYASINRVTSRHRVRIKSFPLRRQLSRRWLHQQLKRVSHRRVWNRCWIWRRQTWIWETTSSLRSMANRHFHICQALFRCKVIYINRVGYRL